MNIIETNLSFGSLSKRTETTEIYCHHAATKKCSAEQIHSWHKGFGWPGIGYHYLVRKDGSIERGRPEDTVGAHASGHNSYSIGICFEGNFEIEEMPEAQKKAGKELIAYLKAKYKIDKVLRHRDVNATACPGKNFPFEEISSAVVENNLVQYRAHLQTYDWQDTKNEGQVAGTTGQGKSLEAFVINSEVINFRYKAHLQTLGDTEWVTNGHVVGTMGLGKRIEAIWIDADRNIRYRVHQQGVGWTPWVTNGKMAGSTGQGKRREAIQIEVI